MPRHATCLLTLATALLGGCGHGDLVPGDSSIANGAITLAHGETTLHASDAPPATITPDGTLSIDGKTVAVTPEQRAQLQNYYRNVAAVREHGIATGLAGTAVAGQAMTSVAKGLFKGDTGQIDKEVNASADKVRQATLKICDDLDGIRAAQEALAASLPAFKPYAHAIGPDEAGDCRKDEDKT